MSPALLTGLLAASAVVAPPQDALVVLAVDPDVDPEMADDVTEALLFSLGSDEGMVFLPKERLKQEIGYEGPERPGHCAFDNECLRKVHRALGTRWFIVVRLTAGPEGYGVALTRIATDGALDVTRSARTPRSPADLINKIRALAVGALDSVPITLLFEVSEAGAAIEVNGKALKTGQKRLQAPPGIYTVRISKPGFLPFETRLPCKAGQQCVVTAQLAPESAPGPATPAPDPVPTGLIIGGWTAAGIGAVLTGVGVAFGVHARNVEDELNAACAISPCSLSRDSASAREREGEQAAAIFNGAGISGMVLLVGGIATAVTGHLLAPATEGTVEVTPALGPGGSVFLQSRISF